MSTTLVALQIQKGVPMPVKRFSARTPFTTAVEGALSQMQAGDSFSYEDESKSAARRASVREVAKRLGIKVTVHKIGPKEFRVWKTE